MELFFCWLHAVNFCLLLSSSDQDVTRKHSSIFNRPLVVNNDHISKFKWWTFKNFMVNKFYSVQIHVSDGQRIHVAQMWLKINAEDQIWQHWQTAVTSSLSSVCSFCIHAQLFCSCFFLFLLFTPLTRPVSPCRGLRAMWRLRPAQTHWFKLQSESWVLAVDCQQQVIRAAACCLIEVTHKNFMCPVIWSAATGKVFTGFSYRTNSHLTVTHARITDIHMDEPMRKWATDR